MITTFQLHLLTSRYKEVTKSKNLEYIYTIAQYMLVQVFKCWV